MILRLRHATAYAYEQPVSLAAHLLHLRPRSLPWQRVRDFALAASPAPSRQRDGVDHFGNPVAWMFHDEPHAAFEIVAEAVVELLPRPLPPVTPPWEQVSDAVRNQAWAWREAEFAFASGMAPALVQAREYARPSFPPGRPVAEAACCLARRIGAEFGYEPGATTVATPLSRVFAQRAGVCQDFAHAMIAGLRGLGLPARYVSGYLLTRPPPGEARLRGADQSHAWVGCWLGPGLGWLDLDPTNSQVAGLDYVCLGWGRDYGDVSPTRGVLLGGGVHTLRVSVDVEPAAVAAGA